MTEQDYIDAVLSRPPVMQWKADEIKKKDAVKATANLSFARLVALYPWPFATGHAVQATTANVSEYTLKGNGGDCAAIVSIRYGTGKKLLEKWDENTYDEMISAGVSVNEDGSTDSANDSSIPYLWFPYGEENKNPRVKIHGTPTSIQNLYYRYYKKKLQMDIWPDQWALALIATIEADLFGSGAPFNSDTEYRSDPGYFTRKAERMIDDMIAQYERSGGEDSPAPLGRAILSRFRRRSDLHGY